MPIWILHTGEAPLQGCCTLYRCRYKCPHPEFTHTSLRPTPAYCQLPATFTQIHHPVWTPAAAVPAAAASTLRASWGSSTAAAADVPETDPLCCLSPRPPAETDPLHCLGPQPHACLSRCQPCARWSRQYRLRRPPSAQRLRPPSPQRLTISGSGSAGLWSMSTPPVEADGAPRRCWPALRAGSGQRSR